MVRRAAIDDATAAAYAAGIEDLPGWAVEEACRAIGFRPRREWESAWPDLGAIRAAALTAMRTRADRAETARLLAPPDLVPVDPAKLANLRADVRALLERRRMDGAGASPQRPAVRLPRPRGLTPASEIAGTVFDPKLAAAGRDD